MSRARIGAVLRKEWLELRGNRGLLWTFVALAVIAVLLPLGLSAALGQLGEQVLAGPELERILAPLLKASPDLTHLTRKAQLEVYALRQFHLLFLLLPVIGTLGIATYSIIGEKTSRTLEPLLATPLSTLELILGKSLAAALPAVGLTWLAFGVFAVLTAMSTASAVTSRVFDATAWLLILLVTPLAALLALGAGILVSTRSRDPRGAQQVGGLLVLPLVVVLLLQAVGLTVLGVGFVVLAAVTLLAVDLVILALAVQSFRREQILVHWR